MTGDRKFPDLTFDRYARIVTDALTQAGEGVEESGFPRIGIAEEGNHRGLHRWMRTLAASVLRSER